KGHEGTRLTAKLTRDKLCPRCLQTATAITGLDEAGNGQQCADRDDRRPRVVLRAPCDASRHRDRQTQQDEDSLPCLVPVKVARQRSCFRAAQVPEEHEADGRYQSNASRDNMLLPTNRERIEERECRKPEGYEKAHRHRPHIGAPETV